MNGGIKMIREKIDKIVNKYYNETDECYNSFRYDDKENEFYMEEEIKEYLTVEKVDFKIENVSGYSNSAYDSNFLAVTWIENNELNLFTLLLEEY